MTYKIIQFFIFALGLGISSSVLAVDYSVSSSAQVPEGFKQDQSGWYRKDDTVDKYRVVSGTSTSDGSAGSRSSTTAGPDTSTQTNIFNVEDSNKSNKSNPLSNAKLKAGDVDMYTIPLAIAGLITFLLGIAGTASIVALIYHAVQMQINSGITGDSSGVDKAKKGMYGALVGFVIALLAWFIVTRVVELLYSAT